MLRDRQRLRRPELEQEWELRAVLGQMAQMVDWAEGLRVALELMSFLRELGWMGLRLLLLVLLWAKMS